MMFCGVTKSGSPTVKLTTSVIVLAMLNIFLMGELATFPARLEMLLISFFLQALLPRIALSIFSCVSGRELIRTPIA
jgi:hypothetical protein